MSRFGNFLTRRAPVVVSAGLALGGCGLMPTMPWQDDPNPPTIPAKIDQAKGTCTVTTPKDDIVTVAIRPLTDKEGGNVIVDAGDVRVKRGEFTFIVDGSGGITPLQAFTRDQMKDIGPGVRLSATFGTKVCEANVKNVRFGNPGL